MLLSTYEKKLAILNLREFVQYFINISEYRLSVFGYTL